MAAPTPRAWRLLRVPALGELARRGGVLTAAVMCVMQVVLTFLLWRAVYAGETVVAGLDARQAVGYAVLALLVQRIRWGSRLYSRESLFALVRDGRIAYWYLRPIDPRRYHLLKSLGEIAYWGTWSAAGFVLALASGILSPPADAAGGAAAAAALVLGQVIAYQVTVCVELLCFWTTANANALRVYAFSQDLLSGAFVPLWYFPGWLLATAQVLPFQTIVNVPVSLYVGRIPAADAPEQLVLQCAWCCVLGGLARFMWWRAGRRIEVQGG
ncbi:ABC-2 family transporter protein [Actinomadura graeca]|uniref:ABC-2 family transporter protein n=1 Tax=Actinomadura graeca TaxID=2750812 RepID=A0ABX8QTZ7_9ACTN|nr:ABC-2 family transporter protein [Actinomadura graeca]QXJ22300.1 ABC-2 family transporter protein [Actinomadura graeca]